MLREIEKKINVDLDPFDHAIIKNILPQDEIEKAEADFKQFNNTLDSGNPRYQKTKRHLEDFEIMPKSIKEIIKNFYSQTFISILEKKFQLNNIKPDWTLRGGGMHSSQKGGFLKLHSDFIYTRKSKMRRVLNLLIYLNSNWEESWKGSLELWDKKMTKCKKKISPLINNAIIFRTDMESNHGFPEPINCPEDISRMSIALYYYIEEKNILPITIKKRSLFHAVWKGRPNENEPVFSDQDSWLKKIKNRYFYRFF
jgi:Rps23 Pro-64 3,4-dihydroxylase Tpa1-like proline 4-hydroxylase